MLLAQYHITVTVTIANDTTASMQARGWIKIIFSLVPLREGKYPSYTPACIVLKHT